MIQEKFNLGMLFANYLQRLKRLKKLVIIKIVTITAQVDNDY